MSGLSSRPLLVFGLVVAIGITVWAVATVLIKPDPTFVTERACPDSDFNCVVLRVPRDHFVPGSPTWEVTFALHRATETPRQGVIVIATGGPGSSGVAVADDYTSYFDPRIPERYDIVFFDQRGIGRSQPLQCPNASLAWYATDVLPTSSSAEAEAYAEAADAYVADCLHETGVDPTTLGLYATAQAVEDLTVFLDWLDAEQVDFYGESYGTQYAQVFATAHPDRVHALFLDGPVDLTLQGADYHVEAATAHGDTLAMVLDLCTEDARCRADVEGGDALAVYDALVDELDAGPMTFDFVTDTGAVEERAFSLADLESAVADNVTPTFWRMLLQRAMAQASRGEVLPLARLGYLAVGQDADTLELVPDLTWSDALYFAVDCSDYAFGEGSAVERADQYLAAGTAADVDELRLGSVFYGNLPCVSWPVHGPQERPAYLTDTPYPLFVLASTADPATPYVGAERIVEEHGNAYFIVQPGGPHVIYLRGNPCPDDIIAAYLLDGVLPERMTTCDLPAVDYYVPIPAAAVDEYESALEALSAVDGEINNDPDYWDWDTLQPLTVGCLFGGTVTYTATDIGYDVTLTDCAYSEGLALSGEAVIDDEKGTFSLEADAAGGGAMTYERSANGERVATGDVP